MPPILHRRASFSIFTAIAIVIACTMSPLSAAATSPCFEESSFSCSECVAEIQVQRSDCIASPGLFACLPCEILVAQICAERIEECAEYMGDMLQACNPNGGPHYWCRNLTPIE